MPDGIGRANRAAGIAGCRLHIHLFERGPATNLAVGNRVMAQPPASAIVQPIALLLQVDQTEECLLIQGLTERAMSR